MNAPMEPAHSRFGGSVATRILRCPASVALVEKVPAHLRKSSSYADRGTALHAAMALLIEREVRLDALAGSKIGEYLVTVDDVENALRPVLAYVEALLDQPGAEYFLEHRVRLPGVEGAFGTCDLLIRIGRTIYVIDYKFGSGVLVRAIYPDGDEDVISGQLLFYAAGARHSLPDFFAGVDTVTLTILQPMSIDLDAEMESTAEVTHAELDAFIAAYRAACVEALAPAPRLVRGDHRRFCAARPICPAHTAPLLDLAQFTVPMPPGSAVIAFATPPDKQTYLQLLAEGLNLVDAVKDIRTALHDQAKRALDNGDVVPGYTLSAGRAVRQWRDEVTVAPDLLKLGLMRDDVIEETLRTPRQVELRAKARGVQVPSEFIISSRSGTSLVRDENARAPIVPRSEIVRSFAEALTAFQEGGNL
jgi:Protein of unknown function (DUF2800)